MYACLVTLSNPGEWTVIFKNDAKKVNSLLPGKGRTPMTIDKFHPFRIIINMNEELLYTSSLK